MVSAIYVSKENNTKEEPRTEPESHANMPVVGRNAYIIPETGRIANVNPFTPDYDSMWISIVDAAVRYDCPYDSQTYTFVLLNALFVPYIKRFSYPLS